MYEDFLDIKQSDMLNDQIHRVVDHDLIHMQDDDRNQMDNHELTEYSIDVESIHSKEHILVLDDDKRECYHLTFVHFDWRVCVVVFKTSLDCRTKPTYHKIVHNYINNHHFQKIIK